MIEVGDKVICNDTSGFSVLEVEVGQEYLVEEVLEMCYVKLVCVKQTQKMWRFQKKGE